MAYNPQKSLVSLRGSLTEEEKLAIAINKATPVIQKMMKSKKEIEKAAAIQLRALLTNKPEEAGVFIETMLNNLSVGGDLAMGAPQKAQTVAIYKKMKSVWDAARSGK